LGGIYALEGVLNTSTAYHRSILEALSAFVRDGTQNATGDGPPSTSIQAALTVIGRRKEIGPEMEIDLTGAHIPKAVLGQANLSEAMLNNADLRSANLFGADVSDAELRGANLRAAKLPFANLRDADLRGADLSGADLRHVRSFKDALYSQTTKFPANFDPKANGMSLMGN
jgi:hypothetical protein